MAEDKKTEKHIVMHVPSMLGGFPSITEEKQAEKMVGSIRVGTMSVVWGLYLLFSETVASMQRPAGGKRVNREHTLSPN